MLWACLTPERRDKTLRIVGSLASGWGERARFVEGVPPDDGEPFLVWGQLWTALEAIPEAIRTGRPFWQIDNGYWHSAGGRCVGYYRVTYRGLSPVLLQKPDIDRATTFGSRLSPWRKNGKHILFGVPGPNYGRPLSLDMPSWIDSMSKELGCCFGGRPVVVRAKGSTAPVGRDLKDCWALVTHSSNIAVDAVLAGVPVFVAPTNAAAPVGNSLDLSQIEDPGMPDRQHWWQSLMCQQFTLQEMADGTAYRQLRAVREQVDGH